ncbi:MAG: hypothetical protein DMG46_23785 [Acidobacteria bacterium]|nr:MAG: hypothetical protein DMG46_23785 [Acidobacteriota bacterium]
MWRSTISEGTSLNSPGDQAPTKMAPANRVCTSHAIITATKIRRNTCAAGGLIFLPVAARSRVRVSIGGYGEGLAFDWNYVEIDPNGLTDRLGIPQVRFHTNAEYDHAFAIRDEIYGVMEEILRASGAEIIPYQKSNPYPLGSVTHEAGGGRMGDDPKTAVLDRWNRCHDIKNLLVVDASCFVTHPEKQITHTIFALSYRACDHLAQEFRLGNV